MYSSASFVPSLPELVTGDRLHVLQERASGPPAVFLRLRISLLRAKLLLRSLVPGLQSLVHQPTHHRSRCFRPGKIFYRADPGFLPQRVVPPVLTTLVGDEIVPQR